FKSEASDDLILSIASGLLAPSVSPSVKGDVSVKRLGGNYHVTAWLPSDDWYIASMTTPSSPRPVDISAVGLLLKSGQKSNLNIVLKNGAASLSGRVIPKTAGSSMPERLLVYLIPMDEARVDERLRFTEAVVQGDETFSLKNIAPGTYRILVREIADESRSPVDTHEGRLELMGEAKSASTIELHSCERQTGFKIKY
ncbi:MAG TPA: hypothetical protein VFC63_15980, partial [Blastocatellia bacterium]|nr:hypothetical protein [Blastocatellia bacterium]